MNDTITVGLISGIWTACGAFIMATTVALGQPFSDGLGPRLIAFSWVVSSLLMLRQGGQDNE